MSPAARQRRGVQACVITCVVGTVITMAMATVLHFSADENALGTLLLFAPRRFVPVTWLALAATIVWLTWRWAVYALAWSAVSLVLVGGFSLPALTTDNVAGPRRLRVVTFNVDYAQEFGARLPLAIDAWQADIVLMQACSQQALSALQRAVQGEARAGKVGEFCIATRHSLIGVRAIGLASETPGRANQPFGTQFLMRIGEDTISVVSVHFASPRDELAAALRGDWSRLSEASRVRRRQAARLSLALRDLRTPFIVAGDFNVLPQSTIYRDHLAHLRNAFDEAGWGFGFTMHAGVHRLRIDHVLLSDPFVARDVSVGRGWRTEHQPVVVDVTY